MKPPVHRMIETGSDICSNNAFLRGQTGLPASAFPSRFGLAILVWAGGIFAGFGAMNLSPLPEEQAMANLAINHPQQGRATMQHNEVLQYVARRKAEDMAAREYFGHTDPDGFAANFIAAQAGYDHPYGTSPTANSLESIGVRHQNGLAGTAAAQIVFDAWMNSAPHKLHVLGENAGFAAQTYYAVGYAYDPAGPYGYSSHYFAFVSAPPDTNAVFGPYAQWRFSRLTLAQMNVPGDDFDQDSTPALIEYLFDLDPTQPDLPPPLGAQFNPATGRFRLAVPLRPDLDPAIRLTVEATTGGKWWFWNSIPHTREGNELVVTPGAGTQRFFRLGAER